MAKIAEEWLDGICNSCGSIVIEMPSEEKTADYQNRCTNPNCIHHRWHHVADINEPEYYKHGTIDEGSGLIVITCGSCGTKYIPNSFIVHCTGCGGIWHIDDQLSEEQLRRKPAFRRE